MSFVIVRSDTGTATMFSLSAGRDWASPVGGWVSEPVKALQFAREKDGQQFLDGMLHYAAPFCMVQSLDQVVRTPSEDSHGL